MLNSCATRPVVFSARLVLPKLSSSEKCPGELAKCIDNQAEEHEGGPEISIFIFLAACCTACVRI